jgi:predicted dehydrogenase
MNRRHFISNTAMLAAAGAIIPRTFGADASKAEPVSGMNYAPQGKPQPVVKPGEFVFGAAHFDHGHIYGMCSALIDAGGTLKSFYEPDAQKVKAFQEKFPQAKAVKSLDEILADPEIKMVAAAAVTSERGALGCRVMEAGKDYFTDKAPFTTMEQLAQAKTVVARTGRKYMVYYGERLHNESAMYATDLVNRGVIGRVVQVTSLAPHRISLMSRPAWFFEREKFGGILCDIGSHQFEQFLTYAGATDATVSQAVVANFANPDKPEFEDYGEANLIGNNGAMNYVRVDWFTPDGLSTWGDGRTFILGTKGFIECRKYVDLARDKSGNHVFICDDKGERQIDVTGKVGFRFFGELILDVLNRTEKAMTQAHAFKAAELSLLAQNAARRVTA